MKQDKQMIIGVTGGVGAGKSTVLELLKTRYDARIILADLVAHREMSPGSEGLETIQRELGTSFLAEDGTVDRKALADRIFKDEAARETVNSIIHPRVWKAIRDEALQARERLIVVEAAIFDTAPADLFDEIWYIYVSEENRITRLMESRGYSREKCAHIIRSQDSEETYRKRCQRVIDNNGTPEETEGQLEEIFRNEICQHSQRQQR